MDLDESTPDSHEVAGGTLLALALAHGVAAGVGLGMRMHAGAGRVERRLGEYVEGLSLMRSGGR
jgi:hypothetical protein